MLSERINSTLKSNETHAKTMMRDQAICVRWNQSHFGIRKGEKDLEILINGLMDKLNLSK